MKITLTGVTGFIGKAVASELLSAGHTVTALVRSHSAARLAAALGSMPVVGDTADGEWLAEQFAAADAAISTALPQDATAPRFDATVAAAAVAGLGASGKPYLHTSGAWVYGNGQHLTERSRLNPPALVAWRPGVAQTLLDSPLTATILAPGVVYGAGLGIPALITSDRDDAGRVRLVGNGEQRWTTVHVRDLARLYRGVVESGSGLGYLLGVSGHNPTVRELAEATGAGWVAETAAESRERLGAAFADALLMSQHADGAKARSLGWEPRAVPLVRELQAARS